MTIQCVRIISDDNLNDVISIVLDELKNELKAEFAVIRLFSDDIELTRQYTGLFVSPATVELNAFSTMLKHKNPVCGRCSQEQRDFLFGEQAEAVRSAAIIPLVSGANLGLIGLGANNIERFSANMGTDFLSQTGELISASLAVHLEQPAE